MSLRIYRYIALAVVIGAPIIANVASNAVPGTEQAVDAPGDQPAPPTQTADRVIDDLPKPLPVPPRMVAAGPGTNQLAGAQPIASAAPSLDVGGIAPQAFADHASAAPPPVAKPVVQSDAVVPPPPPSVPRSKRY